ncbi:MAG: BatD family protein [Prevotellaceae bacterium]|nr:BatD family protein [Prevotellaceae bacterium]
MRKSLFSGRAAGLFLLLFCSISAARADDVSFTAAAPRVVGTGESFRVTFSVNADAGDLTPPDFSGFHVIAGPSRSTEQQFQIVNGKTSHSQVTRFIYVLQAVREGQATLGAASVAVDKQTYRSQPVTIEVVKAEDAPQASQNRPAQQDGQQAAAERDGNDVFVRILVGKSNVYRGEYLTATVKIYSQSMNIAGFEDVKFPTFNGFWSQEVESPQQLQFQRENVNGKVYNSAVVRRYVLFPQQTGALKIDPFEITCALQVQTAPRSIFDDFFGSSAQIVRKHLASPAVTVQVNPLPANAPASFAGAVGTGFRMTAELARDSVTANDAAAAIIKISGEGNVKLVEVPKLVWPPDFETYDVKISDNSKTSSSGVSGSKQFEIPFIPRSAGTFSIPPVEFTYFDIAQKQYVTLASKPLDIRVGKDPNAGSAVTVGGLNRQAVRALGEDIRYIKTDLPEWQEKGRLFFGSLPYYLLMAAEALVFVLCCLFLSKRRKDLQNVVLVRNRKANKMARRRLKTADRLLKAGNESGFYEELTKALWGYLSDKLAIAAAGLSRENARETLQHRRLPETDIETFLQVIDECEFARYAPAGGSTQMQKIYEDAITVVSRFEQKLKS